MAKAVAKMLEGKCAVVTGSGRGIGREIAMAMARNGAKVVINDLGGSSDGSPGADKKVADDVVTDIKKEGGVAVANYDSVADFAEAKKIIDCCVDSFGRIDVMVNVAGISQTTKTLLLQDYTAEDFDIMINVNLKGTFNCCHHAYKAMINQSFCRTGRIINFTSDAWRTPVPNQIAYAASKGGVVSLTRTIAKEGKAFGITANAIAPVAATRLHGGMSPQIAGWMLRQGLVDQWMHDQFVKPGPPEHIPPIVVYLASSYAANITGKMFGASKGRIALYAEPDEEALLYKEDGMWTPEELIEKVPQELFKTR